MITMRSLSSINKKITFVDLPQTDTAIAQVLTHTEATNIATQTLRMIIAFKTKETLPIKIGTLAPV